MKLYFEDFVGAVCGFFLYFAGMLALLIGFFALWYFFDPDSLKPDGKDHLFAPAPNAFYDPDSYDDD
jgi:hypothetical protein